MWLTLRIEVFVFVFLLLFIIIRAVLREHSSLNKQFLLLCYDLSLLSIIKVIALILPFSSYIWLHYIVICIEISLWLFVPYLFLKVTFERIGFSNLFENTSFRYLLSVPLEISMMLIALSPFYGFAFTLNLFGEPIYGDFFVVLQSIIVLFYFITFFSCVIKIVRLNNFGEQFAIIEFLFYTVIMFVFQVFYNPFINSYLLVAATIIVILVFINLHDNKIFIDALTGLNNRNRFMRYLDSVMSSSRTNFYLTYVDIDDFKKINDNYGHITGDLALRTVAEGMHDLSLTTNAFFARIGGDEFAIISKHESESDLKNMLLALEQIVHQKALANMHNLDLSISLGTTELGGIDKTMSEVIKIADRKMYLQKKRKKNHRRAYD